MRENAPIVVLVAAVGGVCGAAFGLAEADKQRVANELRGQAERDRDAAVVARGAAEAFRDELKRQSGK